MSEILLLKQQIEFLQLELDEAKSRESQLKSMYDSMLKSLSFDSPRLTVNFYIVFHFSRIKVSRRKVYSGPNENKNKVQRKNKITRKGKRAIDERKVRIGVKDK